MSLGSPIPIIPLQPIGTRIRVCFDTETWLFEPGLAAPRIVCLTYQIEGGERNILLRTEALAFMREHLKRNDIVWVGQNIAYDFGCLCALDEELLYGVFRAYDENRVVDVRIREKLLLLAVGKLADEGETGAKRQVKFSLDQIVLRRFGDRMTPEQKQKISDDKKNPLSPRLRYHSVDDVPLDRWPAGFAEYALDDAWWTMQVLLDQDREQLDRTNQTYIPDEYGQVRGAWWLHLARIWGVRTNGQRVYELAHELNEKLAHYDGILKRSGVLKGKYTKGSVKFSKDMKILRSLVVQAYGSLQAAPKTDKGAVSTDRDCLTQVPVSAHKPGCKLETHDEHGHPNDDGVCEDGCIAVVLSAVADRNGVEKILSTYVPALLQGATVPICPNWNDLVATGRTSCWDPNLQNPPRKGAVRECVEPRLYNWFVSADYAFIELCTLAQWCLDRFGFSKLADAINAGIDPHLDMAADLLGITYEEAKRRKKEPLIKEHRQLSKALNFGLPGGLGAEKFVMYARDSYGVIISVEEAKKLKPKWLQKWPEMVHHFKWVADQTAMSQSFTLKQPKSNRLRGDCGFCDGCNTGFQGLAADGAKHAGYFVAKECYLEDPYGDGAGPTALYGCRIVLFLHDEFILEVPESRAHEACVRLCEVMEKAMAAFVPQVKIKAEPALMRRWLKGAEPVYNDTAGKECKPDAPGARLVPWEPELQAAA